MEPISISAGISQMRAAGLSQRDVAALLHLSIPSVRRLESGGNLHENRRPSVEEIVSAWELRRLRRKSRLSPP